MRKRLISSVVGLSMLSLTACGTLTGAAVGAAAGAIYDIYSMNK